MDSLLCESPSLIPTLSLPLPQAPEGLSPTPAAASPSVSSNQGKVVKVSGERPSEAFPVLERCSDCPCFHFQIKEESVLPQIKLEPHEVDQFLNLSPKGPERVPTAL